MKRKRGRRKRKRKARIVVASAETMWGPVRRFLQTFEQTKTNPRRRARREANEFVRTAHMEAFGVWPTPGTPIELAKARVMYKLQHDGFVAAGQGHRLSADFMQNHEHAMTMQPTLTGFTSDIAESLKMVIRSGLDVDNNVKRQPRKDSARRMVYDLYWSNNETRFSDEEIQRLVLERFPEAASYQKLANIRRNRRGVNKGKHPDGVPPSPILEYDDEGNVVEKRKRKRKRKARIIQRG